MPLRIPVQSFADPDATFAQAGDRPFAIEEDGQILGYMLPAAYLATLPYQPEDENHLIQMARVVSQLPD